MIEVDDLCYRYRHDSGDTLSHVSFSVQDQEIFGFLGPSGAGKSTTQKILIGLLTGYRGSVRVLGRELSSWASDYYEQIGVSFELPNHYGRLTARENLEHFASLYSKQTALPLEVLEWVGLSRDADKRVSDFSKGMKIRLNVARSLLHRPRLLFLDEPTSGLDPTNAAHIKDLILRLRGEGTTVFITTHDMGVADQLCDRVAFLASGELKTVDAPSALRKRFGRRSLRVEYAHEGANRRVEFDLDRLADDSEFQRLLRDRRIETMHSQETTLEQVFIEVTGQELSA